MSWNNLSKIPNFLLGVWYKREWRMTLLLLLLAFVLFLFQIEKYWNILNVNKEVGLMLLPFLIAFTAVVWKADKKGIIIASLGIVFLVLFFFIQEFDKNNKKFDDFKFVNTYNCITTEGYSKGISSGKYPVTYLDSTFYKENFSFIRLKFGDPIAKTVFGLISNINYVNSFISTLEAANRSGLVEVNKGETRSWLQEAANDIKDVICNLPQLPPPKTD